MCAVRGAKDGFCCTIWWRYLADAHDHRVLPRRLERSETMIAKVHNNISPRYALTAVACAAFCTVAQGQLQFDAPVVYPTGSAPSAVLAIDLDGDGDLDLVAANRLTHNVSVMLNEGDGTFAPAVFLPNT